MVIARVGDVVRGAIRNTAVRAYRFWESLKVEMHGKYSVERMRQLQGFSASASVLRAVLWMVITALPCLAVTVGLELLPLEPPEQGFAHSKMMVTRYFFGTAVVVFVLTEQCLQYVATLPRSPLRQIALSLLSSTVVLVAAFGLAYWLGSPVPFLATLSAPFVCSTTAASIFILWRKQLRESVDARAKLHQFVVILSAQLTWIFVYPLFTYVFNLLTGTAQTAFALVLPLLKIAGKNAMSHMIKHAEDTKAEFVTFHVEIFHAIYVTTCLQNSTSIVTSVAIAFFDIAEACLSLRDLQELLDSVHKCIGEAARSMKESRDPKPEPSGGVSDGANGDAVRYTKSSVFNMNYLDAVLFLVQSDKRVRTNSTIRLQSDKQVQRAAMRTLSVQGVKSGVVGSALVADDASERSPSALPPEDSTKHQSDAAITKQLLTADPMVLSCASPRASLYRVAPQPTTPATPTKTGWGLETQDSGPGVPATETPVKKGAHEATPGAGTATPTSKLPEIGSHQLQYGNVLSLSDSDKRVLLAMSSATRLEFVQKVLQALYMSEILLLVEYVEVIIPCVYSTFMVSAFNLSNREYYPRFEGMTARDLSRSTTNVMAYVAFEVVSLVLLVMMLQRKLHVSGLRQLAFVLETQWREIQSKVVLWVLLNLMSMPAQCGVDFSFQFKWLHADTSG